MSTMTGSVGSIVSLSTAMSKMETGDAVSTAVFKKAIDSQEQAATQLIQSIPDASSAALPDGVGGNINVKA